MCPEFSPPSETRPYVSAKRDAAAARKRQAVIDAATRLLDEGNSMLSMEAVAKGAGVTRLTVYKQFGSRRSLLEAVFDDNAARGGLARIRELMQLPDPREALYACLDLLCAFWGSHPGFAQLHDAAAGDPEFAAALNTRNERRRLIFTTLLARMPGSDKARTDAADLLFGMTGMPMFRLLIVDRTPAEVAGLLKAACAAVLDAQGIGGPDLATPAG